MELHVQKYWKRFLEDSSMPSDTGCYDAFAFGASPHQAAYLLGLILAGDKTATSSLCSSMKSPKPQYQSRVLYPSFSTSTANLAASLKLILCTDCPLVRWILLCAPRREKMKISHLGKTIIWISLKK